jgi:serine O-acetyltransferase
MKVVLHGRYFLETFSLTLLFIFTFFLRLCNSSNKVLAITSRLFHYHYSVKYALKIHPSTSVGYGFYIGHGTSVVINPSTVIGNNVSLSQFTSIGSSKGKAAHIGDCCYIGPNVSIVEHVIISAYSTVGAGSVVVKDVESHSTVVGVPAKKINASSNGQLIVFKWDV